MQIAGKEIKDEKEYSVKIKNDDMHGIKQERENIAKMIKCQMKHREEREK